MRAEHADDVGRGTEGDEEACEDEEPALEVGSLGGNVNRLAKHDVWRELGGGLWFEVADGWVVILLLIVAQMRTTNRHCRA